MLPTNPRWQREEEVKRHVELFLFCFAPKDAILLCFIITPVSSHSSHPSPNLQVHMYQA